MKINVELHMKNANAKGIYNSEDRSVLVLTGAHFEHETSPGFLEHNYRKLRDRIIEENLLNDKFILQEDLHFNSLSSSAAVIGGRPAAGPLEWKLSDGRTVKDYETELLSDVTLDPEDEQRAHVIRFIEDIDILDNLESNTKFNLFETLSIVNTEIRHSNVLAWLLSPMETHGLKDYFVKHFVRTVYQENKSLYKDSNIRPEDLYLWEYDNVDVYREAHQIDILLLDREHKSIKLDTLGNQLFIESNQPCSSK